MSEYQQFTTPTAPTGDFVRLVDGTQRGTQYIASANRLLYWNDTNSAWEDADLAYVPLIASQGLAGVQWSESDDELRRWNGSSWVVVDLPGGTVEEGNGINVDVSGSVSTLSIDVTEIIAAIDVAWAATIGRRAVW